MVTYDDQTPLLGERQRTNRHPFPWGCQLRRGLERLLAIQSPLPSTSSIRHNWDVCVDMYYLLDSVENCFFTKGKSE